MLLVLYKVCIFQILLKISTSIKKYFYNHIKVQTANVLRCDLCFDRHVPNSLKSPARAKRGTSIAVKFRATTVLPKNFYSFLRNPDNKTSLFRFLAKKDGYFICNQYQDIVVTNSTNAVALHSARLSSLDISSITSCDHKDADSCIFLHCIHASNNGFKHIMITTVDSDVLVLAIHFIKKLDLQTLWLNFGVGKHRKFIAVHEIAASLTSRLRYELLFFHAFS